MHQDIVDEVASIELQSSEWHRDTVKEVVSTVLQNSEWHRDMVKEVVSTELQNPEWHQDIVKKVASTELQNSEWRRKEMASTDSDLHVDLKRTGTISEGLETMIEGELERELQATTWELVALAFMEGMSMFDSLTIVFACVINVMVQLIFMEIIGRSFIEAELPDMKEVQNWRMIYGHDQSNYLSVPQSSLVSAVCSGDQSLIISTAQQLLLSTIEAYNADIAWMPMGAVLCVIVLFIWFLIIGREAIDSVTLMVTMFCICSRETKLVHMPTDVQNDRPFMLESVGKLRMVIIVLMTAIRLFICFLLMLVGSVFLANTLSIRDLVLNAAALAFIIDIDELIYESFAPLSSKALLNNLQPLKRPSKALWAGPAFLFFGSIILVGIMMLYWVVPNISLMVDINDVMCGGHKDFIIGPSAFGLQMGVETKTFDPDTKSYGMDIVKEVWTSKEESSSDWSNKWTLLNAFSVFKLGTSYFNDPDGYIDFYGRLYMRTCDDFPLSTSERAPFFKPTLEYQTGIANIPICSVAASFCAQADQILLRLLCPVTCGCHDPLSGLYRDGKASGCPIEKCRQSSQYMATLDSLSCADMDTASLAADPRWARFWDEAILFRGTSAASKDEWKGIKNDFMVRGCGAYASLSTVNKNRVCIKGPSSGAITSFCPVTCGCSNVSALEGCATDCLRG